MVIKVCGIKTTENIKQLSVMNIDMVGLNFYPPSVRYISKDTSAEHFDLLPKEIKRVGVFVNETRVNIDALAKKFQLNYIQLHGDESVAFCKSVAEKHKIIKVFRVDDQTDFNTISEYAFADYYLFDTATKDFGGSGKKFDWSVLEKYRGEKPFLLSGGIGPLDAEALKVHIHPKFIGIDINSKFESEPAIKDPKLLTTFMNELRDSQ